MCFRPASLEGGIINSVTSQCSVSPSWDWTPERVSYVYVSNTSTGTRAFLPTTSFQVDTLSRQTISPPTVCPLSGGAGRRLAGANLHVLNSLCQHPYTQSDGGTFTSVRDVCALKLGPGHYEECWLRGCHKHFTATRERQTAAPSVLT